MTSIIRSFEVTTTAQEAWEKVSDTGGVTKLTGLITECRLDGENRFCTMADGSKITERIISVDAENRRLVYTVTDGPMPLEFHCASMQVQENGVGARLTWTVDIKPDALAPHFEPMMDIVAESIRSALS